MALSLSPFALTEPKAPPIALVCDSPHSGTHYPSDFDHAVPLALLRQGEDTHVDALWQAVPEVGGTLLAAHFPRTYIDPNRTEDDIDPELLAQPWPTPLNPSEKTRLGYGLIWRRMNADTPLYARRLSVDEVRARIEHCYRPYHAALSQAIARSVERFGAVWHLNLHSMPNNAYERLHIQSPRPLADFVLGDRDGSTCEPALVELVAEHLKSCGYSVAVNDPYKGVQLIAQIGQPALRRHSLQIEIRRPIYMDEATRERKASFSQVQADLRRLLQRLAQHIQDQTRTA